MGKAKKTRKFAAVKRIISAKDPRLKKNQEKKKEQNKKKEEDSARRLCSANRLYMEEENDLFSLCIKDGTLKIGDSTKNREQSSSALFFQYNTQLGPPYRILIDTNFVNFSIQNKLDVFQAMMDCLYAKCIPYVTDCVMGELEKLGSRYRVALRIVKDPRFERLPCMHQGTYADDCLVNRVTQHKCYIVATCDRDLKRRIRKIPGVPIMFISQHRYTIERMPDAFGAPRN